MSYGRQAAFWLLVLLVFAGLVWLLSEVLLPFVAGIALAYLQAPLADRMERWGINRTIASLLIVTVVMLTLIALVLLVLPLLVQQLTQLVATLPEYVSRIRQIATEWLNWLQAGESTMTLTELVKQASAWLTGAVYSLWAGGKALVSFASILIIMPVVTFYLILDWHGMIDVLDSWVPPRHREAVRQIAHDIDAAISGFVRGQLLVCLMLGLYYVIALWLIGLKFALVIGIVSGLITFVPYIGSLTGLMIGTSVAIAQFWPEWQWVLGVVAIFLFGQFVEGNIIAPKLVGERVGLHPVWIIFAMFAFGYLFGFVGLLLAVPIAAAIAVLFRFGLKRYLASPIYSGGQPT